MNASVANARSGNNPESDQLSRSPGKVSNPPKTKDFADIENTVKAHAHEEAQQKQQQQRQTRAWSPQRKPSSSSTPLSPRIAAAVPLPASPAKNLSNKSSQLQTPVRHSQAPLLSTSKSSLEDSPNSRDYDFELQTSLAKDMEVLNFSEASKEPRTPSYPSPPSPAKKVPQQYIVPEIPAYKQSPNNAGKVLKDIHSSKTGPTTKHQAHGKRMSDELYTPTFPPTRSNTEITALTGVLLPAMKATHDRRLLSLNGVVDALEASGSSEDQADRDNTERVQLFNDMAKELEAATRAFQRIEALDKKLLRLNSEVEGAKRITMGGGVDAYLEGFLEEVLVRVEAVDEDIVN